MGDVHNFRKKVLLGGAFRKHVFDNITSCTNHFRFDYMVSAKEVVALSFTFEVSILKILVGCIRSLFALDDFVRLQ